MNELVTGVSIALGEAPVGDCPQFDRDESDSVSVDELVAGINDGLVGCEALPTATGTRTTTATATPTATPTNRPPIARCLQVYRTHPGSVIEVPIEASDPDGDDLNYAALPPAGGAIDELTGVFTWTPAADQLGPFYLPFTVTDAGSPPASSEGQIAFRVTPLDACTSATCEPAAGCTDTLVPLDQACCGGAPVARVAEPVAGCPEGRILHLGRNIVDSNSFGRMQNCDIFRVNNSGQIGATVRFHVEARCLNIFEPIQLQARMETKSRLLFENNPQITMAPQPDGFARRFAVSFAVRGPGPFFEFEGAEANLRVTLTDRDGVSVSESLRLVLTFTPQGDLPDVDPSGPEPPVVVCREDGEQMLRNPSLAGLRKPVKSQKISPFFG